MFGKRPSPPSSFDQHPYIVTWEATRACALTCQHCRASAQPQRHPLELSQKEAGRLIDQVAAAQPGIFIITGGDPMMRLDLRDLIQMAAEKDLRVALGPSATPRLMHTDFHELKQRGLHSVSLSLDGAKPQTHDAFRGFSGTWVRTLQAAQMIQEAGLFLQINTTLSDRNLHELPEFFSVINFLKPNVWSLFFHVPTGRGTAGALPSADETEDALRLICQHAAKASYMVKTTEAHHYRRVVAQHGTEQQRQRRSPSLADGRGFVFVSHTGDIQPSGFLPITAGNVRRDELLDVYRNHPLFRQLRDPSQLKGKCRRCEFNRLCGGSRARAYAVTGDPMEQEPLCNYQPSRTSSVALAN